MLTSTWPKVTWRLTLSWSCLPPRDFGHVISWSCLPPLRVGHISTCRRPTSGSMWYRRRVVSLSCTFQRAVLAALCGTDGGSCHFRVHFNVPYWRLYLNVWLVAIWTLMYILTFRRVRHFYSEWIQCKPYQFCAKSLGIGTGLGSSSFKTTDFFAVNHFMASILLCDQLRICFKQSHVTLVLNSYLVRCLSASTSSNTSSVHNFVQLHSNVEISIL